MSRTRTRTKGSGEEGAPDADPVLGPLKKLYDEVANEPLPDDLMKLLDRLDEAERNR
ncbi:hypothetical protein G5B40_09700 [Pikeienuella piscinae]|uniref:Anti-sigma factor NepR domain-containing protein n=1 Tax=Pikeienuella piscinae TaxID=2748098 RepID=A0A7L5BZK1_9RHOB|nr:NepR family anti-sigma factor [Pikeienuella piscinae]QIE55696.1 hypothetical protein G5B40_09700 [Pikeienuella piscinae]